MGWKRAACSGLLLCSLPLLAVAAEPELGPQVGEKVKDFELPIVGGDGQLKLSEQYEQGPVVVVVLRGFPGYQCPICSRQVSAFVSRARTLKKNAQRVVFIYPGPAESLERRAEEFMNVRRMPEPLVMVRDADMKLVEKWGLRWDEPRETAYPSTFVIDSGGTVRWAKVSQSHGERSSVEEILKALRKL